jgi:hypothetical protein
MKDLLKNIFCKHQYTKIGFRQVENSYMRYSLRLYECQCCGKTKWVDGRFDKN